MIKRRVNNDINIDWTVSIDGSSMSFRDKTIKVFVVERAGDKFEKPSSGITISGNVVSFTWLASEQNDIGIYTIMMEIYEDGVLHNTVDIADAIELVPHTFMEDGDSDYISGASFVSDISVNFRSIERATAAAYNANQEAIDLLIKIQTAQSVNSDLTDTMSELETLLQAINDASGENARIFEQLASMFELDTSSISGKTLIKAKQDGLYTENRFSAGTLVIPTGAEQLQAGEYGLFVSSLGSGGSRESGDFDESVMWQKLITAATQETLATNQIDLSHLALALGVSGDLLSNITAAPSNGQVLSYNNGALEWITTGGGSSGTHIDYSTNIRANNTMFKNAGVSTAQNWPYASAPAMVIGTLDDMESPPYFSLMYLTGISGRQTGSSVDRLMFSTAFQSQYADPPTQPSLVFHTILHDGNLTVNGSPIQMQQDGTYNITSSGGGLPDMTNRTGQVLTVSQQTVLGQTVFTPIWKDVLPTYLNSDNGKVLAVKYDATAATPLYLEWITVQGASGNYIPLSGSNAITGSLIPSQGALINLGSQQMRWANGYFTNLNAGEWLTVSGVANLYADITIGHDNANIVKFNALVESNIKPSITETYNLGSPELKWNVLYAKSANVTNLMVDGVALGDAAFSGVMTTPEINDTRLITSGGVYNALLNKLEIGDVNAENLGGGVFLHSMYYSHHPEVSNVSILPFLYNDLAGADIRTDIYRLRLIHTDESQQNDFTSFDIYGSEYGSESSFNPSKNAMFDCSPSYFQLNKTPDNADLTNSHTAITVLDIVCLGTKYFNWSNRFYVDFGNASWSPKTVELYVAQSNARSGLSNVETAYTLKGTWQKANDGGNSAVALFGNTTHRGRGDNDGVGFDRIRFVFYWGGKNSTAGRYMNYLRIAQVGLVTYNSNGAKEGFVSRNYDTTLYCNLNPAINGAKSIGTASNKWSSVYANTFYGVLSGNATTATTADTAQTLSCNAITSGTIDNQGYEYQKVKWYSYIAKPAIDNASKGFATNSYANGILALCTYPRENASYYHRLAFSGNGRIYHQSISNGSAGDWREIINASDSQTITGVKTIDGSGRIKLAANAATGAATGAIVDNDNRTVLAVDTTGDGAVVLGNPNNARPLYIRGKDVRIYGGGTSSIYGIYVGTDGSVGIGGGLSSGYNLTVTGSTKSTGDIIADATLYGRNLWLHEGQPSNPVSGRYYLYVGSVN